MHTFNFTPPPGGRNLRPSAARIIAAWKKAGRPDRFTVEYGETFAEFERYRAQWQDTGNGCRGVDRQAVVRALELDEAQREERDLYIRAGNCARMSR